MNLNEYMSNPWMVYLQTLSFILVIAALVSLEMFLKKTSPLYGNRNLSAADHNQLCRSWSVSSILMKNIRLLNLVTSFAYAAGFGLALILCQHPERILWPGPKPLQDVSIGLITAGMISVTFMSAKEWFSLKLE
jgi:electron transport complex protein RnfA